MSQPTRRLARSRHPTLASILYPRCSPGPGLAASTFKHGAIRTSKAFQASPLWLKATRCPCEGFFSITVRFHQSLSQGRFVSAEESVNHGRMCVAEVFLGIIPHMWARKVGEGLRAIPQRARNQACHHRTGPQTSRNPLPLAEEPGSIRTSRISSYRKLQLKRLSSLLRSRQTIEGE